MKKPNRKRLENSKGNIETVSMLRPAIDENLASYLNRYRIQVLSESILCDCRSGVTQQHAVSADNGFPCFSPQLVKSLQRTLNAGCSADLEARNGDSGQRTKQERKGAQYENVSELRAQLKADFYGIMSRNTVRNLPTGMILVSNVGDHPLRPTMQVVLGPRETRDFLWLLMLKLRVNHRTFSGFMNYQSYRAEVDLRVKIFQVAKKERHELSRVFDL